jgi:hypothetical protein
MTDSPATLLAQEVRRARAVVLNDISNRRYHPSYGYTKTQLRKDWDRFVSLAHAYSITFQDGGANDIINAQDACDALDISYHELEELVRSSLTDPFNTPISQS